MSITKTRKERLDEIVHDPHIIELIMEIYRVDEENAKKLWTKVVGTLTKIQAISGADDEQPR